MEISLAVLEDAPAILALQQCAYQTEAAIYNDYAIPPLRETLEELQAQFQTKHILKATLDGSIVGSVRGYQNGDTCYVERLIVQPEYRRRGIGAALLLQLEYANPTVERLELFTGHKSVQNIRLYERVGYKMFRHEVVNEKLTMIFLKKTR
jgi:ribosomal protein S18 acetylase RimI-like enzyme